MFNSNKPFRPPTKDQLALRGLAFLAVIAVIVGLVFLNNSGTFGGKPKVAAIVKNAGGSLVAKSDVKDHGVIVGYIEKIEPCSNGSCGNDPSGKTYDGNVKIVAVMNQKLMKQVPQDVVGRILPANVFGTSYLDLSSQTDSVQKAGGSLGEDATIHPDTRFETIELQNALDDIDRLVKALSPKDLSAALGALSSALDGRGKTIGDTAVEFNDYLKVLQPEIPTLQADIAKSAQALGVLNKAAPGLLSATSHALNLLDVLVQHQADLDVLIKSGISLSNSGKGFLAKNSPQLVQWLHDVSQVTDALYDNRRIGITGLIQINSVLGNFVQSAVGPGRVKIDAVLSLTSPRGY